MARYDAEFPEQGDWWRLVDRVSLSMLAERLVEKARIDVNSEDRLLLPGLRTALRQIAQECGVK